jgi:hypothetical protein
MVFSVTECKEEQMDEILRYERRAKELRASHGLDTDYAIKSFSLVAINTFNHFCVQYICLCNCDASDQRLELQVSRSQETSRGINWFNISLPCWIFAILVIYCAQEWVSSTISVVYTFLDGKCSASITAAITFSPPTTLQQRLTVRWNV